MSEICTCDLCRKRAEAYSRVAAFGAIRRAAEVARDRDRRYANRTIVTDSTYAMQAMSIRFAIRAAIGSDKT